MWKVPLFDLSYDAREEQAILSVLRRKWLSAGEETAAFEASFAAFLGHGVQAVALANCTAALHLALMLHGVGPGDEVIIPALTFVADANVVALCGARPVPADCASLDDWNVSAQTIEPLVNERTKAVIIVHYAGMPCETEAIRELCARRGLALVEDVAHAVGADIAGRQCGTFGDYGCFSFFSNKNLSVGEGGMIATRDPDLAAKARLLRSHGMTSMTVDRHAGKAFSYDVVMPGLNYRIDEMRSALGRVQLAKLEDNNRRRETLDARYRHLLASVADIAIPFSRPRDGYRSSRHIFPILLPQAATRPAFMTHLKERGIQTSIHYPAMDTFTHYKKLLETPPVAADIAARTVTLPLYPDLREEDLAFVCGTVTSFFRTRETAP